MSDTFNVVGDTSGRAGLERLPGRRTIIKGAAWSVPILAAAVAAPAQAASGCTGTPVVKRVTGIGANKGVLTFTLPANARCITFVVEGAGGGGPGTTTINGGSGARIEGSLTGCGSNRVLTLVAGGGGTSHVGGDGFGRGGDPVPGVTPGGYSNVEVNWGSGGGGGSAILIDSTPVVVAGGGGGSGSHSGFWESNTGPAPSSWVMGGTGKNANGGVAPGGNGDDCRVSQSNWFLEGDGGRGASGAVPGAGDGATWNLPTLDAGPGEVFGGSGTGPTSTGGAGGNAVSQSSRSTFNNKSFYVYSASGAGGGGYAGGGAGGAAAATFRQPWGSGQAMSTTSAAGAGGAGSNFLGSATASGCTTSATSATQGTAGNGGRGSYGGVGSVTVSYYL